jgi:hypothetical protein
MTPIAWDIETVPFPLSALSSEQRSRYRAELKYRMGRDEELSEDDASRLVRSLHPFLGWICCIAVAFFDGDGHILTKSRVAATPEDEYDLLQAFWTNVASYPSRAQWVTFNGKRFDVPFTQARSIMHGLAPSRTDITDTYPFNHRPHADLLTVWPSLHYRLEELCAHLGVTPSKSDMSGAGVADAVAAGRIDEVATYCEADARATLECWQAAQALIHGSRAA